MIGGAASEEILSKLGIFVSVVCCRPFVSACRTPVWFCGSGSV